MVLLFFVNSIIPDRIIMSITLVISINHSLYILCNLFLKITSDLSDFYSIQLSTCELVSTFFSNIHIELLSQFLSLFPSLSLPIIVSFSAATATVSTFPESTTKSKSLGLLPFINKKSAIKDRENVLLS